MRKYIIVLLVVVLLFNGFNNLREITDLAIVRAIGLDLTEDGNYKATVIVLDTSNKEKKKGIVYEATGPSVQDAIRNIVDESPKKLYLAHLETLVVSENLARQKCESMLNFFIRDNEGSNNFYLLIAKDTEAKDVINTIDAEEISMKELIDSSVEYKANSNLDTLNDNISDILKVGNDICVNVCSLEDDKIKIEEMAYFKEWNMQGYLDEGESITYNLLKNNVKNALITMGKDEDLIVSEIISNKSKISYSKGKIKVNVSVNLNISESGTNIELNTDEEIEEVSLKVEEELKSRIETFIYKCQNVYNVDIIGFENLLYRKKVENTEDVKVETEVSVKISNQGGVVARW